KIEGVELIRIKTPKGKFLRPISYNILSALHALMKGHYDIIHLHAVEACFILPLLRLKYPVVSTSHGTAHSVPRDKWNKLSRTLMGALEFPFTKFSNYATSISKVDAEDMESRYKKKVIYIPNGVDLKARVDETAGRQALKQYGINPGDFLMFAAGRIDPTKGCHLAIEAYRQLGSELPLLVLGDLEQVPAYGNSLRQMGASCRVIFSPPVTDKAVFFGILKQCKLFIFPSLSEGMSMMLLEAGSLGVPMICSDIPENRAVMKDFTVYFESGSTSNLKEKLQWALEHTLEMELLSQKASKMLASDFSWDKLVGRYETLYQACLAGKTGIEPEFG
ncbi:MAG: glycosyltransferase family 4 protein, partial [Omnitrophica WOR_2 bacterium]